MKRFGAALFAVLALLSGCAYAVSQSQSAAEDAYAFYYMEGDLSASAGGDAIGWEEMILPELVGMETVDAAERMMQLLLSGPRSEFLKSPFPNGTQLNDIALEDTHAIVDLTFAYSSLSGIALTIADYCITLTLSQLSGISTVSVTVRGQELAYRDSQTFSGMDVLLTSGEDVVSTVPVTLWFLDENGALTGMSRRLDLYEGDTQISALLETLQRGPVERGLTSALPEGFAVLSTRLEDGVCYVNLSSLALQEVPTDTDLQKALDAVARSLTSLDAVSQVRYLVDGEFASEYGHVPVAETYPREE